MKINTALLKTLRGDILQFMYNVAPSRVKESTITESFCEYFKYRDILRALLYLTDKGYLDRHEIPSPIYPTQKHLFYTISADGMCLVEGTNEDKGITVEKEDI